MGYSWFEKPYAIRNAAGNVVYESAAFMMSALEVKNTTAAAATIGRGEAVTIDPANMFGFFPRWDYALAGTDIIPSCFLAGKRVASAADVGHLGVAAEDIPGGQTGRIIGPGSITAVKVTATLFTIGFAAVSSATVGSCTVAAAKAAGVPAYGVTLGVCVIINQVATPGSGSTTQAGVLISPQ